MNAGKTILLLEDNEDRISAFEAAVGRIEGELELVMWRDAPTMIAECEQYFTTASLICLDHDLNPQPGAVADPGTGLEVAQFLADFLPVCPVLIHSSNTDRVYSMHNELRFANWMVERVGPLGNDWIPSSWLRAATKLLAEGRNTWRANLRPDHVERVRRMQLSLAGLSLGDALGEMLSSRAHMAPRLVGANELPGGPWFHTDDTEMAISICAVLKSHGAIEQDALAKRFARRFERDPERGYGRMTRIQLREIIEGANWRDTAANAFSGQGSMGNGSAMRVAPLGAYFADDLRECAEQAHASSVVTHTHPEAIAGAIATAAAAAMAWQLKDELQRAHKRLFEAVLQHTPESEVKRRLLLAADIPGGTSVADTAKLLGKGDAVTAQDTVPFCIWMAAHHLGDFTTAIAETISVGGDCDTNAAIVGGIVALRAGPESIPPEWLNAREKVRL
jgi:ADP-ribosylglycohydrolase